MNKTTISAEGGVLMTINKAYKFRLYPQKEQQVYFSKEK